MQSNYESFDLSSTKYLRIYDFDETLTKLHTFASHGLVDNAPTNKDAREQYFQYGKDKASENCREGLREHLQHNSRNLTAIATHHNNHAFIAGFISEVLGKNLIFVGNENYESHGIASYKIKGTTEPLLISYIDAQNTTYKNSNYDDCRWTKLNKIKNIQIEKLMQVLLNKKIIDSAITVEFYDDDEKNINAAKNIPIKPRISTYHVSKDYVFQPLITTPQTETTISSNLFLKIIASPATKIVGAIILIAGLAALTVATAGIAGIIAGISAALITAGLVSGSTMAVGGTALIASNLWSSSNRIKLDHNQEVHSTLNSSSH